MPVYAGAGGSVAQAKLFARAAKDAGADGLLLLPPYLVEMPQAGLVDYTREVAAATDLPVIVYNRNNARFTEASAVEVRSSPTSSDSRTAQAISTRSPASSARSPTRWPVGKHFQFFNGLPTAEASQQAYRAIGVPLYSSATFAFAPDLALAFYDALEAGNEAWPPHCCASSSTRWSGCATRCPATPSRWSRRASRWKASPPGRFGRR